MGAKTGIEWTDATWTPIRARNLSTGKIGWHCEHSSEGCRNCYAEGINIRLGTGLAFKPGHRKDIEIFLDEKMLTAPLRWRNPKMIFVCSMTDLFADFVPDGMIDRVFAVMALCPQHIFQVLTKRSKRMRRYMDEPEREAIWMNTVAALLESTPNLMSMCHPILARKEPWLPLPKVWLGVSAEDQENANTRIPDLLDTPAAIRFLSAEPLLGPIDLTNVTEQLEGASFMTFDALDHPDTLNKGECRQGLDWVIAGGESGPGARPMHPVWARSLRDQCAAARVPFHFKQWGEWLVGEEVRRPYKDGDPSQGTVLDYISFQDGDRISGVSDHDDIVVSAAIDAKQLTLIWKNYWGTGAGKIAKRIGKKAAGRLLDGVEHNELPERQP